MYASKNMMKTVCVLAIAGLATAVAAQNQSPWPQQDNRRPQAMQQQDVMPPARGQNLNRLNRAVDGVLCTCCGAVVQGQGQAQGQRQGRGGQGFAQPQQRNNRFNGQRPGQLWGQALGQFRGLCDGTGGGPALRGPGMGQGPGMGLRNTPNAGPRGGFWGQPGMMPQQPQRRRMVQPQRGQQFNQSQWGTWQGIGQCNPGQCILGLPNSPQRAPGQRGLGQQQGFGPQSGLMPPNARQQMLGMIRNRAAQMRGAWQGQMRGQPMNNGNCPCRSNTWRGGQGQRGQGGRF